MRKPVFCICKNKDEDQPRGTHTADHAFVFPDSTIPLLPKPLTIFCIYTAGFLFKQIGNPEDGFSHDEANIYKK